MKVPKINWIPFDRKNPPTNLFDEEDFLKRSDLEIFGRRCYAIGIQLMTGVKVSVLKS